MCKHDWKKNSSVKEENAGGHESLNNKRIYQLEPSNPSWDDALEGQQYSCRLAVNHPDLFGGAQELEKSNNDLHPKNAYHILF